MFRFEDKPSGAEKMEIKIKVRYKQEFENVSIKTMDCYWSSQRSTAVVLRLKQA